VGKYTPVNFARGCKLLKKRGLRVVLVGSRPKRSGNLLMVLGLVVEIEALRNSGPQPWGRMANMGA